MAFFGKKNGLKCFLFFLAKVAKERFSTSSLRGRATGRCGEPAALPLPPRVASTCSFPKRASSPNAGVSWSGGAEEMNFLLGQIPPPRRRRHSRGGSSGSVFFLSDLLRVCTPVKQEVRLSNISDGVNQSFIFFSCDSVQTGPDVPQLL